MEVRRGVKNRDLDCAGADRRTIFKKSQIHR